MTENNEKNEKRSPTTWLVEKDGFCIRTASDPSRIRLIGPDNTSLSVEDARELLLNAIALLGGVHDGASAAEGVALRLVEIASHSRDVAEKNRGIAFGQIADLKAALAKAETQNAALQGMVRNRS